MLIVLLSACSNTEEHSYDSAGEEIAISEETHTSRQSGMDTDHQVENTVEMEKNEENVVSEDNQESLENIEDRKIIYNAYLHLETEIFDKTVHFLETEAEKYDGYIVTSNYTNHREDTERFGRVTVRIPADNFHDFITLVENGDLNILEKSVSGEDVTEQYVDLTSRLKSKKIVEERLLSFLNEAEKTEDLLKISNDLAEVQEEIEQLTGKINYLENQSDYATIDIDLTERIVEMPSVHDESLSTWEKTKEQFTKSIQALLSIASGLFIFLIGNTPIIILILIIGLVIYFVSKNRLKRKE